MYHELGEGGRERMREGGREGGREGQHIHTYIAHTHIQMCCLCHKDINDVTYALQSSVKSHD